MLKVELNGAGTLLVLGGLTVCTVKTVVENIKLKKENKDLKSENGKLDLALNIFEVGKNALVKELEEYEKEFGKINK